MIQLDRDIAMPIKEGKYPFAHMEIGDSFFIATEDHAVIQRRLVSAAYKHKSKKFTARVVDGGVRCWRIG